MLLFLMVSLIACMIDLWIVQITQKDIYVWSVEAFSLHIWSVSLREKSLNKIIYKNKSIYFKFRAICKVCEDSNIEKIAIPFVLRYLTNELAAMNIKFNFTV